MHKIDADGHVSNQFDDGDAGTGTPATAVDADWLNAVQGELVNAVEGHGVALVKGDNTQLRELLFRRVIAPGGRLSASSSVPVTTSDILGVANINYVPYANNVIELYDGTRWVPRTFVATSQAMSDTTKSPAAAAISSNYDVFGWDDAGTFRISRGPVWTSDTARGSGAGTTQLELFEGRYVNAVAITNGPAARRGLYLGTIRTSSSAALVYDGERVRFCWNNYNRVPRSLRRLEATASWNYTTATDRAANGQTTLNRVEVVRGLDEDTVSAHLLMVASNTAAGTTVLVTFGLDSASTRSSLATFASSQTPVAGYRTPLQARFEGMPGLGFHHLTWIEFSQAAGTTTWLSGGECGITGECLA